MFTQNSRDLAQTLRSLAPMLAAALLLALLGIACDSDKEGTAPQPALNVMGVIMMDRVQPEGGPYQVGVVVTVDGELIQDATVLINDEPLAFRNDPEHPELTGYSGLVSVAPSQEMTLTVSTASGDRTLTATAPGLVQLTSPTLGSSYEDAQDIDLTWVPAAGAGLCAVTCMAPDSTLLGMWLVTPATTDYAVPAASTLPPACRLSVIALSGAGSMPTTNLQDWVGEDGFWVGSQDWVDVLVNP